MEWKDLKGYEGLYKINRKGEIFSEAKKGIIYGHIKDSGYCSVGLVKDGVQKHYYAHRLVAENFIENPHGYECVIHKNRDKADNRVENLEWSPRTGAKRKVINIDTGEVYDSVREAGAALGIDPSNIAAACNHKRKKAGGYHWKH